MSNHIPSKVCPPQYPSGSEFPCQTPLLHKDPCRSYLTVLTQLIGVSPSSLTPSNVPLGLRYLRPAWRQTMFSHGTTAAAQFWLRGTAGLAQRAA